MDFNQVLIDFTGEVDSFMYTYILLVLLVAAGIYFTCRTRFVQIRYLKDMFVHITEKKHDGSDKTLNSFQAMMVSTASRVGTGNIAGVATAVALGGPGAVFWMWVMSLIGAATAFVESTLAQIWKIKKPEGGFMGGPAYYIQQGLGKRWVGVLFAILLILCFAFGFNGLQAYNAASSFAPYVAGENGEADPAVAMAVGLVLVLMTAAVIFGGTKRISAFTSILVPIMALVYIALAVFIVATNFDLMPAVFGFIFSSAFDFESIFGGFAGSCVMLGIKRGLYSNEAGMGSAPNAAAAASVSHPVKQGLIQSLSVYIDTLLLCTCSAMIVMVFYVQQPETAAALNGIPLVQLAIQNSVGNFGMYIITFAIWCFAYTSLLGNYFYAESNLLFITKNRTVLFVFRVVCCLMIFYGATNSFDLAWNLADIFMGFMAMLNLVAIFILGKWAFKALDDYTVQRKKGLDPVFVADGIEGIPRTECWHVGANDLDKPGHDSLGEVVADVMADATRPMNEDKLV